MQRQRELQQLLTRSHLPPDRRTLLSSREQYGTFKYEIFEPPAGHPVYNKPMPGIGWKNNSLFSFWADPLSRPAGVKNR